MGIILPQTGQQATRENVIQTAQQAEKEGFDSLWVFERLLWPTNPQTPYPVTPDGSLPIEYQIVLDLEQAKVNNSMSQLMKLVAITSMPT